MTPPNVTYEALHETTEWAYGEQPDHHLVEALRGVAPGAAVDLGGGQGRHALYLASLGFDVELVDLSAAAVEQAQQTASAAGVPLRARCSNIAFYRPPPGLTVVVAALLFHVPARHASLEAAGAAGSAMAEGGLMYFSLPGFDAATQTLASDLLDAAGCEGAVVKHVVTRQERPRLPVPRRNETRVVGYRR
jgi:2-polyprenyl-3-methyl-5-hydroxy-6-metoxy-1,4-benzoquinol methylase